jgi:hypothetical protein
MADGGVKFIKNTISLAIWWPINTIKGKEVVSQDSY